MNPVVSIRNAFTSAIQSYVNFITGAADYGGYTSKREFWDALGMNVLVIMMIPTVLMLVSHSIYVAGIAPVLYEILTGAHRFALAMRRFNASSYSSKRYLAEYILEAFAPSIEFVLFVCITTGYVVSFVLWLTAI